MIKDTIESTLEAIFKSNSILRRICTFLSKSNSKSSITYEGVFANFMQIDKSVKIVTSYLENENLSSETRKLEKAICNDGENIFGSYRDRDLILILATIPKDEIRLLDIGAGFGKTFLFLNSKMPKKLHYTAVELLEVIGILNNRMQNYTNFNAIEFSQIIAHEYDVIYFGSSIQYFEDYIDALGKICKLKSPYIFIADTPFNNTKSFATLQVNMKNRRIPFWVLSALELEEIMERYGYELASETIVDWHQSIHNFDNFPKEFRKIRNRNLLFTLKDSAEFE